MNKDADRPGRILEVWFPGVHGDVGGGGWADGLSDNALAGLGADDIVIHRLVNGPLHTQAGAMAAILDQDARSLYVSDNDRPSKAEEDLPILHEFIRQRFIQVPDYRPAALRGLRFRLWENGEVGEKAIQGISGLRAHRPTH